MKNCLKLQRKKCLVENGYYITFGFESKYENLCNLKRTQVTDYRREDERVRTRERKEKEICVMNKFKQ